MSLIFRLAQFVWLMTFVAACSTYRYPGRIISPLNVALSPMLKEIKQHPSNPAYNLNDFDPTGGSMQVDTDTSRKTRIDLSFEVYQPLPANFVVGLSVGYASLGSEYLQSTYLHWWDYVLVDRVTLEHTPSVGGYAGWLFSSTSEYGLYSIQYGLQISGYKIKHDVYKGVDVVDGRNYSVIKSTTVLDSGTSIWQTVEVVLGFVRLGLWLETDGSREQMFGLRIGMLTPSWAGKPRLECEIDRSKNEYWTWSLDERNERDKRCGDYGSLLDP